MRAEIDPFGDGLCRVNPRTSACVHGGRLLRMRWLDALVWMPRRSHHTASLLKPNRALGKANGTPLSVRIALGKPKSLKTRSKTLRQKLIWSTRGSRMLKDIEFPGSPSYQECLPVQF